MAPSNFISNSFFADSALVWAASAFARAVAAPSNTLEVAEHFDDLEAEDLTSMSALSMILLVHCAFVLSSCAVSYVLVKNSI